MGVLKEVREWSLSGEARNLLAFKEQNVIGEQGVVLQQTLPAS